MMKNFAYQSAAIDFLEATPKGILALDMRMGKSRCALMVAEAPVLIVCPVPVKIHWEREIRKWRPDLQKITIVDRATSLKYDHSDAFIVPYSILEQMVNKGYLTKPNYLILDEMHYCKNPRAKRTRAAMKLLRSVGRAALLSGTPMPNRPMELFPVLKELGVVKNKAEYGLKYCAGWMSPWGWDYTGASNLEELSELVAPVMFRRTAADLKDELPPIMPPVVIELDLPLEVREKEFNPREIARAPHSVAFEAISEIMHLSGLRKVPLAVEYIADVLEGEDKVIVWAHHRDVIDQLAEGLGRFGVYTITGSTSDRQGIIDRFNGDDGARVLVGNIRAMGVGVEITGAAYNIFVEAPWVPGDLYQAIARPWGPNQSRTVRTDILTIHRSIDAHVLHKILQKEQDILTVIKETEMTEKEKIDDLIVAVIQERAMALDMNLADYLCHIELIQDMSEAEEEPKAKKPLKKKKAEKPNGDAAGPIELSLEDVRQGLAKVMREESADRVRYILGKFDATKVSDLDESQFAAVLEMAESGED